MTGALGGEAVYAEMAKHHEMGLYTTEQMMVSLEARGLQASYEPVGLTGRGLCIGVKGNESNES